MLASPTCDMPGNGHSVVLSGIGGTRTPEPGAAPPGPARLRDRGPGFPASGGAGPEPGRKQAIGDASFAGQGIGMIRRAAGVMSIPVADAQTALCARTTGFAES
ncbi:MAG: hypothetical protein OXE86_03515 [Alphaproteobacteria bacterium]|nr:hypothetical protein [Alphaproteobacteria bacterium]